MNWLRRAAGWILLGLSTLAVVAFRTHRASQARERENEALREAALRGVRRAQENAAWEERARERAAAAEAGQTRINHQLAEDMSREPTDADVLDLRRRLARLKGPPS